MTLRAAFLSARGGKVGAGEAFHLCQCHPTADEWQGQLSHSHPQGLLNHIPTTRASSTMLPRQDTGAVSSSVAIGERWGQLSCSAQTLDIHVVPGGCPNQGSPYVSSSNTRHGHDTCRLIAKDPEMSLSGSSGWDLTMAPLTTACSSQP